MDYAAVRSRLNTSKANHQLIIARENICSAS
jgi:hypothetical protein